MSHFRLIWNTYRCFPYERVLGERELHTLFGENVTFENGHVSIPAAVENKAALPRITYFKVVEGPETRLVPDQTKLEASAGTNGSTWCPELQPVPELRRQSTRYSAHGLHEYKGKFNPQVVRSIGNILGLEPGDWLLDPFCGSGTSLLEAAHIGWNAHGIDINPLGVMIANAKIAAFTADPGRIAADAKNLERRIKTAKSNGAGWRERLPNADYLELWFPPAVLKQIDAIISAIESCKLDKFKDIYRIILSDIFRDISYQDPGDLRIRRRKNPAEDYPATDLFLEGLESKIATVLRARRHVQPYGCTEQSAVLGDCRVKRTKRMFDAAITSPPYATALPYMDTQRLSLAVLGLIEAKELRKKERLLIGNREITDAERRRIETELSANKAGLPGKVHRFCKKLLSLGSHGDNGFRRRNVPALAYKYFCDMSLMFDAVHSSLKPDGRYALLVGQNTTTLAGEAITIDTPQLLADIAASRGWKIEELLPFETYQRFDVHRGNSITEERLVVLRRMN